MADQNSPSSPPANGNPGSGAASLGATGAQGKGDHLGSARTHLGNAATAASESVRGATRAAREELRSGTQGLRSELGEFANASRAAAYDARDMADEKLQEVMDQGRELLSSAEAYVREKPLQAIGIAALAGFILAKLR